MAPKKKPEKSGEVTCPEWMMTMGDTMSLLLTFFVLLFTFASLDDNQLMDVVGCVKGALGAVESKRPDEVAPGKERYKDESDGNAGSGPGDTIDPEQLSPVVLNAQSVQKRFTKFREMLTSLGFHNVVTFDILDNGVSIRVRHDALFAEDGTLGANADMLLEGVAGLTANNGNELRLSAELAPDLGGNDTTQGGAWKRAIDCTQRVGDRLCNTYPVPRSKIGYGVKAAPSGTVPQFEFRLMDKIGVREVTFSRVWQGEQISASSEE